MDITSNISNNVINNDDLDNDININENANANTENTVTNNESSDYFNSSISNDMLSNDTLEDILNGKNITINLTEKQYNNIDKNSYFNTLSSNEKTLILNRLYEKLPKNSKILKSQISNKIAYYCCKNCGYHFEIKNETFIFRRNTNNDNEFYNTNIVLNKHDTTLPYTKEYVCINKECQTHKTPSLKKAVFYRKNNTYNIRYICCVCDSYWNNN